jgi:dUTPase
MADDSSSDDSEIIYFRKRMRNKVILCGPKSSMDNFYTSEIRENSYEDFLHIRLEKDVSMQKKAKHFIKLDVEVHVPRDFVAIVESSDSAKEKLNVACHGEFIHQGSHNKRIIFFLENLSDKTIHLKKDDLVGQLRLIRLYNSYSFFYPSIVEKSYC